MTSRILCILSLTLQLAACSNAENVTTFHRQWLAFGTVIDLDILATQAQADVVLPTIENLFTQLHHELHPWNPGPLNDLNRALANLKPGQGSQHIRTLLAYSLQANLATNGYFDPSIGKWIGAWKFHDQTQIPSAPPSATASEPHQKPRLQDVEITADAIRSNNPEVWLDFGGIAKGYAGELALDILKQNNITQATINMGGDLVVWQTADHSTSISIRNIATHQPVELTISGAKHVFTSGGGERHTKDETASHIFDPHSGRPVYALHSITIIDSNPVMADALATGIYAAGNDWLAVANLDPQTAWIAITRQGACVSSSAALAYIARNGESQCLVDTH